MNDFILTKTDEDKRLVFGFFNISSVEGELVEDTQGDLIDPDVLEKAAYSFVLNARIAGDNHIEKNVGRLVESFMITKEKQEALVKSLQARNIECSMDLPIEGWWGGFYIDKDEVWDKITKGDYPMFSIGGTGERVPVEGDE